VTSNAHISVVEDANKGTCMKGVAQKVCANEKEAMKALLEGTVNRTASSNTINAHSSRSHAIFSIYLEVKPKIEGSEKIVYSKINLVDLAGSERTKKTKSAGQTLVEANYINKSLFFLEQMVVALSEKQRDHVPYRHSKLTYLLKDSIGGNSKTIMIANILPEICNLEETISTLKFATRMMKVSNETHINVKVDSQALIKKYEKEITQLKHELTVCNETKSGIAKKKYTPEEKKSQYKQAKKYLKGEIKKLDVESVDHAQALLRQLRRAHKKIVKLISEKATVVKTEGDQSSLLTSAEKTPKKKMVKKRPMTAKTATTVETLEDTKDMTIRDYSTEVFQSEADRQTESDKRSSFNVSSIHRIVGDYDRADVLSQSNLFEERDQEDLLGSKAFPERRFKIIDSSRPSLVSEREVCSLKEQERKAFESKSLNYIQDLSPKDLVSGVIRSENDIAFPRRKHKFESEKIKKLQVTLDLINQSITQANSMLHKQYDVYNKRGFSVPRTSLPTDISISEPCATVGNETFVESSEAITVTSSN